jgi:hypothetical protein
MVIRHGGTRHGPACQAAHGVGVVLVLHAEPLVKGGIVKTGHVPRRVNVRVAGA